MLAQLNKSCRVTIPKLVRDQLRLRAGTVLACELGPDGRFNLRAVNPTAQNKGTTRLGR